MHILLLFIVFLQFEKMEFSTLNGSYTGKFDDKNIRIHLHHEGKGVMSGSSRHKGIFRKLSGTAVISDTLYIVRLEEPGNSPYDGIFKLNLSIKSMSVLGEWRPKSDSINTSVRFYLRKLF